ncbi:MAG: 2-oxo acid dehydrogenase subunit E2 [Devosia nanyangense]|uniref:Dihydrolipoamide acetyltransferase component of pyruvate dehydrogenase complex n=1 Tax=Devosia nanyangense TaxID=1228055 RepID=A0A933L8B0_9HYPH|nr:2-oxo acid dehydrogenase subunit E2 [Devosia nanyangense]
MGEFRMPSLGADMEAGKLVEWLVKPGTPIKRGDIIAVVETQKGAIEIEVFEDGMFERPLVELGAKVPVGSPLALITGKGEAAVAQAPPPAPEPKPAPAVEAVAPPAPVAALAVPAAVPPVAAGERVRVSPAARKLAAETGLVLSEIVGTGPSGEITLADVETRAAEAPAGPPATSAPAAAAPAEGTMSGMRAAIAAAMARSKREIPHYYLAHTVDLSAAEAFVTKHNEGREPTDRLLLGALFVKAVSRAAKKYHEFNGHFVEGEFKPSAAVHVGMAVNIRATGLVAPAIHDSDALELDPLMASMRDLITRVRAGRFRASELSDGTITVSSLGERGVDALYGIIYPPQVAIVGFGTPAWRAWAADGMVGPRRVVSMTLAGDHRVSDGHRGALFLKAIEDLLSKPETL